MNKEEIKINCTNDVFKYTPDQIYDVIYNLKNQLEKLTQENNDLEERVIHQDNLIKQLEVWIKEQIEFVRDIPTFTKEIKLSHTQQIVTYQYVLDKLNELRSKE